MIQFSRARVIPASSQGRGRPTFIQADVDLLVLLAESDVWVDRPEDERHLCDLIDRLDEWVRGRPESQAAD